jgi:cholesterol transport system auxiliary component
MMHYLSRTFLIIGIAFGLASCGSLVELPNSGAAPALYNLTALDSPQANGSGNGQMLMIEDPTTTGGLDLRTIARRPSANELQYFSGGRWNTRTSTMVQAVLAESFENAGQQVSMGRGGAVVPSKYELQIEIRDFQAEYFDGSASGDVHIRMALTLVQLAPLQVVGTKVISVHQEPYSNGLSAIIDAFDRANHTAMDQAITWTTSLIDAAK